jgi:hypothetical protein
MLEQKVILYIRGTSGVTATVPPMEGKQGTNSEVPNSNASYDAGDLVCPTQ